MSTVSIPLNKGFELIGTGWDILSDITINLGGDINITLAQILIGIAFVSLAGFLVRHIFIGE